MERVGVRELNQHTSQVIDRVRRGETIEVTDRGRPVARLVPVDGAVGALDLLVAEGRAVAPTAAAGSVIPSPPMIGDPSVDAAAELAASREDERW
ncbi:type II toxin-antitoxin system prevent-host-death family antitoxin [Frankia sp. AgB1.9]|uniref:type II toxin-antitoxin system Phd/YefM family antitoxin n=1 Tax=unclassified Frankia TaxID=2632575 RepID=UPI0019318BF1|nr:MULTISPECIES: type II toxin-antitoxin system prevent-host-death family antitoxin [unclassified Frankia]MBL7493467.1 type II toxin-antitoxin system prevent-host-death family antitoxin [Frankia sp. AgW1.1]MBL7549036.1 type II toxin-antitoxin system prevent-host-death family antitoxin [Frankia sp. AgB1.9]MBL7619997.1 type II toxin-antitoxin system prevent-host-death family antitoxin [Frankia sp. AgB1.8]